MTPELTNIIQLIKAEEFELAYQLLIGNPWIYMDCSTNDFLKLYSVYYPWVKTANSNWNFEDRHWYIQLWNEKYRSN